MRTSKPFSTISYNTDTFLQAQLNDLVKRNIIDFWCYVNHKKEIDENKDHKHLFIIPSSIIDTKNLEQHFIEPDLTNMLPLKCMPFQSSNFSDWFLYSKHDAGYLLSKGQKREFHYAESDFICSDINYLIELKHSINYAKINSFNAIADSVNQGLTDFEICQMFPVQMIRQVQTAIFLCRSHSQMFRNDRMNEKNSTQFEQLKNIYYYKLQELNNKKND